jgi:hypothetical protein
MATYPQHTTIVLDNAFEAALSLSSKDGRGLDNDDCNLNLVLDLIISGCSRDLDEIQLIHTILNNSQQYTPTAWIPWSSVISFALPLIWNLC